MSSFSTLACGNCVYYAMWHGFPPTASWVFIIPGWFLVLSIIRTWTGKKLLGIPNIFIALPLVLAVFFFAPGMIGPPLGFWIPLCCLLGTWTGLQKNRNTPFAYLLVTVTVLAVVSLAAFGARDYQQYNSMPAAEKEKLLPAWEAMESTSKTLANNQEVDSRAAPELV